MLLGAVPRREFLPRNHMCGAKMVGKPLAGEFGDALEGSRFVEERRGGLGRHPAPQRASTGAPGLISQPQAFALPPYL